ncbi:saccharopine dehydrogenase [Saprolegnia parasitica CBS 223.65]|uniref:Saccharopine dehydrogenase n=1 Tax=Saprolegnia parasitica (strain CBS 223.65) TaxID=695850 RepID=A0A067CEL3_SAPPC|nr:saccharopine dehydrogenase [Saprolegnia parasitica CBS 223.65]KDO25232.1 saccharopine dehydrogenase [Saprolegnia parasitica CBS 223.65]|eukprot:XP_012204067.1 saccharopine dehydrogenase [Saprolegnia parasitica CBS 223.65]
MAVVCFGSGRVAFPFVEKITRNAGTQLVLVSDDARQLAMLRDKAAAMGRFNLQTHELSITDAASDVAAVVACLEQFQATCVAALVPEDAQFAIARACIATKTPLVTASYASLRLSHLSAAVAAGISILCECGLDPGLDHMSAMHMIARVHAAGSRVHAFSSICGGLPAPEAANNPIGYKFTWSPLGTMRAMQRPAKYKLESHVVDIPGHVLLEHASPSRAFPALALEQLPNGNALPYAQLYGIPDVASIFRGTYRYAGFSAILAECIALGLLDDSTLTGGVTSWRALVTARRQALPTLHLSEPTLHFLQWLDESVLAPATTALEAFTRRLEAKLTLQPHERDLVIMRHVLAVEQADGSFVEHTGTLLGYGDADSTFMARSVGLTAAIGVELMLQGRVTSKGFVQPVVRDIYEPALKALADEGISLVETTRVLAKL